MGLGALSRRRTENAIREVPWTTEWDQDLDTAPPTWAGKMVTTETAQQLLVVYGAVSFHADHCSTMPIDQYRKRANGTREQVGLVPWLDAEPYPGLDSVDAQAQLWWSYWMGGHALAPIQRNSLGRVTGYLPLHPASWNFSPSGKLLIFGQEFGGEYLSIPHVLIPGQRKGVNPIEAARQSIGMGLAAAEYGATFFSQGTTTTGVVEMPGPVPAEPELKAMKESWRKSYSGSGNAHTPALLFGGAQWKQMSVTPEQAQFLETRGFTDAQIATQLFQIPPSVLAVPMQSGGTVQYQNIEAAWSEMVRRWLPHLYRFKRAFSKLLPPGEYIEFNVDRYLAATLKERYESYKIGIDAGFLVPNEPRARENFQPLPGGDEPRPARTPQF